MREFLRVLRMVGAMVEAGLRKVEKKLGSRSVVAPALMAALALTATDTPSVLVLDPDRASPGLIASLRIQLSDVASVVFGPNLPRASLPDRIEWARALVSAPSM